MGLKDRVLDLIASLFSPTMDHPAGGGMTGEDGGQPPAEDAEDGTAPDEFDGQTGQDERA